jgi:hypothetical protein
MMEFEVDRQLNRILIGEEDGLNVEERRDRSLLI